MSTYHANAVRSGKWWAVEVAEVPGVLTQGRNLVDAARMAREAVALVLDTDEAEVTIKLEPQLPVEVLAAVTDFQKRRSAREEAEAEAQRVAGEDEAGVEKKTIAIADRQPERYCGVDPDHRECCPVESWR